MQLVPGHERIVFNGWNMAQVALVHVMALLVAPFFFTWRAWIFMDVAFIGSLYALGMFHHMLLTHRSFRCPKWLEYAGSLFATLTWRGPFAGPVRYVAIHRIHHAYSDTPRDPHSPRDGVWHAMMAWFWRMPEGLSKPELYERYCGDVAADPWHRFLDRNVNSLQLLWAIFCFAFGALGPAVLVGEPSLENGFRFFVYGVFVKTIWCLYVGNAVDWLNHAPHPGGYRSYETSDTSTNSFMLAAIHWGGAVSWHNNHHANPAYFTVTRKWWEFDLHYLFLTALSKLGLVWDIRVLDERGLLIEEPARVGRVDQTVAITGLTREINLGRREDVVGVGKRT
jgi:stearoyl-CoA desaturase (delta-9 desaturase)